MIHLLPATTIDHPATAGKSTKRTLSSCTIAALGIPKDMMMSSSTKPHRLHDDELALLHRLRWQRREHRPLQPGELPLGARVADFVAAMMGSWPFIIVQSIILILWMVLNITAWVQHWDPYPFILLNLALSFQAAYAAPFIMMSQNRQAAIDRAAATHDYDVNTKAELEIELLHQKVDLLRETQVAELIQLVKRLEEKLDIRPQ